MFRGVKLCDIQPTFPLEVEKDFLQQERPFSLWQKQWWLCQVEMLMAFVYPLCVIYCFYPSSSCPSHLKYLLGKSVQNFYLMESGPENHKPQMFKAAARPRVINTLVLRVCFCGKASTLGLLLSSPFWVFRLPCKLFFNFSLQLSEVASFSLMLCPAAGALREASVCNTQCLDRVTMQAAQGDPRGRNQAKHNLRRE